MHFHVLNYLLVQGLVRELAVFALTTLQPCMKEFAWKVMMHIKTFIPFSTTIHEIKFTQLHLPRWQRIMREGTIVAAMTLPLHVVDTNCIRILSMIIVRLVPPSISLVSCLVSSFALTTALVFSATTS